MKFFWSYRAGSVVLPRTRFDPEDTSERPLFESSHSLTSTNGIYKRPTNFIPLFEVNEYTKT